MFKLNMVKFNAFKQAMGSDPWDIHTIEDIGSLELARVMARDLVRSSGVYCAAEIGNGQGILSIGQLFSGELVWA